MSKASDPYDLHRFVRAQDPVFEQVCAELREGQKRGHWMWFIFPQLRGLGHSDMSVKFGISSEEEARAYLEHPALGPRLRKCSCLVNRLEGVSIKKIFVHPDDLKFRSSMTLFATIRSTSDKTDFENALQKYFAGKPDRVTILRLRRFRLETAADPPLLAIDEPAE